VPLIDNGPAQNYDYPEMNDPFMLGIWIVALIAGAYVIYTTFFFILQSRYIYYPEGVLSADPASIGLDYESVSFKTQDGVRLSGWFIAGQGARGVLLFCHGNAGNMSHRLGLIQIFHRLGLDIFIFDYRGYGHSQGKPSEQGLYQDAEAAWRYLVRERRVSPDEIIVFGRSLGGAVAARLAQSHRLKALILESTFTSLGDIAAKVYPYLPTRLLLGSRFNTAGYLGRVDCPVLIVHSRQDEVIPFGHRRRLFERAREPKRFLEITGGHSDGFTTSGKQYEDGLKAFISGYTKANS